MALTATKLFRRREMTRSANKRHSAGDFEVPISDIPPAILL
jgi:hypothetical protein